MIFSTCAGKTELESPLPTFEENVEKLIEQARTFADDLIFVGEGYVTIDGPIPWAPELELSDTRLMEYHESTRAVCERHDVSYVDTRAAFRERDPQALLEDGCHPNNEGHSAIYRAVKQQLSEENIP